MAGESRLSGCRSPAPAANGGISSVLAALLSLFHCENMRGLRLASSRIRGTLIAVGAVAAVGALVGAVVVAPRECEPLGAGARSAFTSASWSLLAVGGLVACATVVFAVVSEQPTTRRRYGGAVLAGAVVALVVVLLGVFVLYHAEPTGCGDF